MHEFFFIKAGSCTRGCRLDRQVLESASSDERPHNLVCVHLMGAHRARTRVRTEEARQQKSPKESRKELMRRNTRSGSGSGSGSDWEELVWVCRDVGRIGRPSWRSHGHLFWRLPGVQPWLTASPPCWKSRVSLGWALVIMRGEGTFQKPSDDLLEHEWSQP